ncbi:putative serine/threonine-protein kinase [Senna tora]|uniref:Putative serine/threonine-protein kinase n=1 Tax=Senna tora TaxID=362788 RepID=A0A835CHT1_9FABA|nr:putative serine/threonine-protein kinase [Senna tora]
MEKLREEDMGVHRGERGAQVLAGWPSWLTSVAGEAISGWIPRRADSFEKLEKIGQGTYSSVYKARDLETNKIVALKKVRFTNMDPESVRFMAREIIILRRLDHPNVMKLEGMITSRVSGSLYLVFEYMEHDLAGLSALPGVKFSEEQLAILRVQIKCYMQQILKGLDHCHRKGVLHRDIKGSNLLVDNNGKLKIGDFGLATIVERSCSNKEQALTSRVVTLWYRSPELLLGATHYGAAIDLWSTGCILAELFAGNPIMPGRTEVEQLHKIFKLCGSPSERYWKKSKLPHATIFKPQQPYKRVVSETFKDFPESALKLLDVLLAIEPEDRGTAASALHSEFFTTEPYPCDPSVLPKYPPSKEFNVKLREERSRRRRAAANKANEEGSKSTSKKSKAAPPPDAKPELPASTEKKKSQTTNPKQNDDDNNIKNPEKDIGIAATKSTITSKLIPHSCQPRHHPSVHAYRRNNNIMNLNEEELEVFASDERFGARYVHSHVGTTTTKESNTFLDNPSNKSNYKDFHPFAKKTTMGYAGRNGNMQYSGPMASREGNIGEMLKHHERQIQNAVRKACFDNKEISVTSRVLEKKSPCNFLVFGLGHDSLMWSSLNHNGRTVFLEEDEAWIEQIRRRFPGLESYHVTYNSKVNEAENLMDVGKGPECTALGNPRFSMCQLALKGLPSEVYETQWDLIMVDAPTGYYEEAPGRMTAIYTAGMMARNRENGGETHVFVHDVNRVVEDKFSKAFLCEKYMKKQEGRLRHFLIPSHRDDLNRPFCPEED